MGKKRKIKRVVLDTNVILSALLFNGKLSKIVELWENGLFIPLISKEIFKELQRTLEYPKFHLAKNEVFLIINDYILPYFEVVDVANPVENVCRDEDDDKFLSCAISGDSNLIVSGDMDLCSLKCYKSIKIINPLEFMSMFE